MVIIVLVSQEPCISYTLCVMLCRNGVVKNPVVLFSFSLFSCQETPLKSVPLSSFFKGNRFNIIFHNAAGVLFLYDALKVFFERTKEENRFLKGVSHDLQVPSFLAGCRGLGLIDKLVTSTLWRVLERNGGSLVDMSVHYQGMLSCFERWSLDAAEILTGEARLFDNESN